MIDPRLLFESLGRAGVRFYAGVPDSLLKDFCACVADNAGQHVIAANEGGAVALAAGHYLATGEPALVYMQNSGLGNAVNPLLSLADPAVYAIPMLLLVGWRGEPGKKDEPQHAKQGAVTLQLLGAMGIPYEVIDAATENVDATVRGTVTKALELSRPCALVVREKTFAAYAAKSAEKETLYPLTREEAIHVVLGALDPRAAVIATTGMASREVFEYREAMGSGHEQDFLTVGSMGHASQIALAIALQQPERQVICLDGDGAALMHLGALPIIGSRRPANFRHVILNNGAHDSVGGQPTAGFAVDFIAMALACGYQGAMVASAAKEIERGLLALGSTPGPTLLEIRVRRGNRADLGRPTTSPQENKAAFMEFLRS